MLQTNHHLPEGQELIIQGCIEGDRASQAKLYHLYANKMMGVCMWYTRSREEAEEVLQDGFMRVFKYIASYTGQGSFEGWIRKIMVNAALFKYRSKAANRWTVIELNNETHDVSGDDSSASRYDEKELVKLVQTLPPAYRMVFNLYVFEGLKHREIAAALNISEGTSKSNLADGRKILQAALTNKKKEISS